MEVVPAADVPLSLPFARSNVQEWSHLDQLTGVLQQGRVQAHHWASATRAYGKVVDSRRVASASGGVEQRRHQQVEVFQERGPGGSRLHVVRASRLSTSSSSSTTTAATAAAWRKAPAFDNLQLPLNPLDSSPQKTRASVGRSGSIGGRRPPSRPRSLVGKSEAASAAISEEHHDHDDDLEIEVAAPRIEASTATSSEDDDGGGEDRHDRSPTSARRHSHSGIARKKSSSTEDLHCPTPDREGQADVGNSSGGSGDDWRRDARVRRSLQFPGKATLGSPRLERPELPTLKSCSALRGLEALESVFRRGATIADSVNRTLADGGAGGDDALDVDSLAGHLRHEQQQMASSEEEGLGSKAASKTAGKRHSFVTVEKLKEVRGRLRRLGSPPSDEASADSARSAAITEERDDGIVTEEPDKREDSGPSPRIRSFVYGMDAAASGARKTVPGTGSLESRTSNRSSSSSGSRSEEWYNRRKSYGFEQVHEHGKEAQLYGSPFRDKNKVESSTDSGICRSSEMVTPWGRLVGSRTKTEDNHAKVGASTHIPVSPLRASHSIAVNKANISVESSDTQRNSVLSERQDEDNGPQRGRTTVVTLGSKFEHRNVNNRSSGDSSVHNVPTYDNSDDEKTNHRRFSEPVTITIPITRDDSATQSDALSNVEQKKQFYRQLSERPISSSEGNKPFVVNIKKKEPNDLSSLIEKRNSFCSDSTQPLLDPIPWRKSESWKSSKQKEGEMKRHSLAVDPRYVKEGTNHIMSFSQMSQNDNSEQTFTRISASELAKKFDSLSVSRKEQSQSTLQNGIRQFSSGINVSFVQNGFVRNEEEDDELSSNQMNIKKQKKVEFCKTEVHFVADSGRVNIVETDEKPPPTNMFRRRKRNNAATANVPSSDPNKSNLPQVRFGDSPYEKKLLGGNDSSIPEITHAIHVDIANDAKVTSTSSATEISQSQIPSNFEDDADKEDHIFTQANATISATVKSEGNESPRFDSENSDAFQMQASTDKDNMPRSILKNYRKPRPFLLGENDDLKPKTEAEEGKQDEKWGVKLRPVQSSEQASTTAMWRSQVSVSTTAFDVPQPQRQLTSISSIDHNFRESENELQRQLRLLRPAHKKADVETFSPPTQAEPRSHSSPPVARSFGRETEDKGIQVTVGPSGADGAQLSSWTVAERIRHVEEMRKASGEMRGFSTRVNFGAGEATVIEAGSSDEQQAPGQKPAGSSFEKTNAPKSPWSPRQEAEDEKEQGSRNRGLVVRISKADQQGMQQQQPQQQQQQQQQQPKNCPSRSDGKTVEELKKTTTTITIDLGSPGAAEDETKPAEAKKPPVKPERTRRKQQTEVLQSPSLIMKTIRNPSGAPGEKGEASPRTKDGGGKPQEEAVAKQRAQPQGVGVGVGVGAGSTRSQLAALKELYYSGVASEDSADEEVRSYMSAGGDDSDRASELSGSWSRVRAFRNMNKYKTGYSRTAHEEEVGQLSTARPPLPAYNSGRLRSVETFVSTRSGHPKITSISLHYEGDPTPTDASKFHSVHTPPKEADSATPLSAYSPSDTRVEKQHPGKLGVRAEKGSLPEDQTLYKPTAAPQQKDASHKVYDVAVKARAPISYTERCYGDGESGSMSRRSRKSQESDRTYVVERKRFELQKEKYATEREGLVTGKDSANEESKCATPRGSNTFVKERGSDYKSANIDARRQIVEAEMCEEVKFTSTRERRSVSPEKATAARKSETLKSTSTASVEEDEYCEQDVSDESESAEEMYGSIADKKIAKRTSPIYDNVCETGDRPKPAEANKKAGPENGRQTAGKSSAAVKGQSASSSRKVAAVEKRSSRQASDGVSGKRRSESPIYENREIICLEKDRKAQQRTRQEQRQHETAMLEELTRAADQILQAVNGYSDDDSNRPSSAEDEDRGRRHRRGQPLCTISEAPPRKGHRQPAGAAAGAAAARRPQRAAKQQLGPTSSTSSVDSVSERRAAAAAASAARRERAARLVQRASSREQLLQARASSSEDALSSLEAEERRPRPPPPRRQRPAGTSSSATGATRAQPAAQGHKRLSSGEVAVASKVADRTTAKKSLTSHRLRESAKERSTRTASAKRDMAEVKHNTSRGTTDKLPGSSHGLLPSSSKSKNERCISERRTVVAVMPLRPSPSSNVKKIKTTSSRTEGTQVKPVK